MTCWRRYLLASTLANALAFAQTDASARRELTFAEPGRDAVARTWSVPTPGWRARLLERGRPPRPPALELAKAGRGGEFGNVMCSFDAKGWAGSRVRLTSRLSVEGGGGAKAQMWLRADCPDQRTGAFDNMSDRPVLPGAGATEAVIEIDVDADAQHLAIGVMAIGGATVRIEDVVLERVPAPPPPAADAPAPLSERGLGNVAAAARLLGYVRFFHPSDEAAQVGAWGHVAVHLLLAAEPAADAADLAARLQQAVAPLAPTLVLWAGTPEQPPPLPERPDGASERVSWQHHGAGTITSGGGPGVYRSKRRREAVADGEPASVHASCYVVKPLGGGVCCRLPVRVYAGDDGTLPRAGERASTWRTPASLPPLSARERATRLADVALCWGVMQHFYPYFDVVDTDWDAALLEALRRAAVDPDERAFLTTLRVLVGHLHDGHGGVYRQEPGPRPALPLTFTFAGDDLVVASVRSGKLASVRAGDVVMAIDGQPVRQYLDALRPTISAATRGWEQAVLVRRLCAEPPGEGLALRLRRPAGEEFDAAVAAVAFADLEPARRKPDDGDEVAPGIVYFDLDGAELDALEKCMAKLAAARGIVFDLRGYPGSAAYQLMQHLIEAEAASARWNIPIVTLPDRDGWTFAESAWRLVPKPPRLRAAVAFLTGGGAISYAESIMGIVEHYRLGEIVGAATAGTNGNVNPFDLPGGYRVVWTGMKVLKHDGSRHHGVGIRPTVPVEATPAGIAAGRDEVLERAVAVLQGKLAASGAGK